MTSVIRVRSKTSQVIVQNAPLLMMEFWRKALPPAPTKSSEQAQRVHDFVSSHITSFHWTKEQRDAIHMGWSEYCRSMEVIQGQISSGQQALAELNMMAEDLRNVSNGGDSNADGLNMESTGELIDGLRGPERFREATRDVEREMHDAQVRAVEAYARLVAKIGAIETWQQFVQLNFGLRKVVSYVVDTVQFCTIFSSLCPT